MHVHWSVAHNVGDGMENKNSFFPICERHEMSQPVKVVGLIGIARDYGQMIFLNLLGR